MQLTLNISSSWETKEWGGSVQHHLPRREGIHVLVLRHVHVEPPGAGHDVVLHGALQWGRHRTAAGVITSLKTRRDPEIFSVEMFQVSSVLFCNCLCAGKGKFQNT